MRKFIASLVAVVVTIGATAGAGAVLSAAEPEPQGAVEETYEPPSISGLPIMGLALSGSFDPTRNVVSAILPESWHGQTVCVSIVSADGWYEAWRSYSLPANWTEAPVELEFPTVRSRELPRIDPLEMGLTVRQGDCGQVPAELHLVPATWNSGGGGGEGAHLLVNAFRAQETYLIIGPVRVACQMLPHDRRTAFDTSCVLPQSALNGSGEIEVQVNRINRGKIVPGETFKIDLP